MPASGVEVHGRNHLGIKPAYGDGVEALPCVLQEEVARRDLQPGYPERIAGTGILRHCQSEDFAAGLPSG